MESGDSIVRPDNLVEFARAAGLDGICITEHGRTKSALAAEVARRHSFLVIGGLEMGTEWGDVLIFGLDALPHHIYRAVDIAAYVHSRGGVMIAAHPFRNESRQMLKERSRAAVDIACQRKIFTLVSAMEAANGFSTEDEVSFALEVSKGTGLRSTGGSDAHAAQEIGLCATAFDEVIRDEADFIAALKDGVHCCAVDKRLPEHKAAYHPFVHVV